MDFGITSPVVVARIVKSHGIHGEVVLESYSDVEGRLDQTPAFLLMEHGEPVRELHVESRRFFNGRHVIKFAEIVDRTQADALRDKELAVPEDQIGELPQDHFFIHDLVGMKMCLKDGTEIGIVRNVLKTGGVDLLEVGEQGEILIPFVDAICVEIDSVHRVIKIDPPEGLLELNAR